MRPASGDPERHWMRKGGEVEEGLTCVVNVPAR